ncbi:MAG: DUF429 domain-containing protein [Thermosphaera sp.]
MVVFAGLDLSASPLRPSGFASINDDREMLSLDLVFDDSEIVDAILTLKPVLVAVDAPLTFTGKPFRNVDKALIRAGYKVFPSTWRGMKELVERALKIKESLIITRFIETHPSSALKSSGCGNYGNLLRAFGLKNPPENIKNKHLVDALIASLVSYLSYRSISTVIREDDGEIHLLPLLCRV